MGRIKDMLIQQQEQEMQEAMRMAEQEFAYEEQNYENQSMTELVRMFEDQNLPPPDFYCKEEFDAWVEFMESHLRDEINSGGAK